MSQNKIKNVKLLESLERLVNRKAQKIKNNGSDINSFQAEDSFDAFSKLEGKSTVAPFDVWKDSKGEYTLVDGRFSEYRWALKNKVQISFKEHTFKDLCEARIFMISNLLKKPNLSQGLRLLAAQTLKEDFQSIAKAQQGKRTDLKPGNKESFQRFHTHVAIARLAGVSPATATHFSAIQKDGDRYFGKEQKETYIDEICSEVTSIGAVYRKLEEAKEKEKAKADFFAAQLKSKTSQAHQVKIDKTSTSETKVSSKNHKEKAIYDNPSTDDGFENKIIHGDNRNILKKLPDAFATVVLTSPPYDVDNVNYDIPFMRVPYAQYLKDLEPVIIESARILRDGGTFVCNIADVRTYDEDRNDYLTTPIVADIVQRVKNLNVGLKFYNTIIWNKHEAFKKDNKGSLSPACPVFKTNHEYLIVFKKNTWDLKPIGNAPSDLTRAEYREYTKSVWNISPNCKGKKDHPCPFPSELAKRVTKLFSYVGDVIVDPYLGTGTVTAIAASLGRKWFGCDISEKYCDDAEKRTQAEHQNFLASLPKSKTFSKSKAA